MLTPSASYSFTVRIKSLNKTGMVGQITSIIGESGGDIGAIDIPEQPPSTTSIRRHCCAAFASVCTF